MSFSLIANSVPFSKSGLPAYRYQFHFPSNQYMDPADRQIDLVKFLQGEEQGLKEFFKPEFMKGLSQNNGEKVSVTEVIYHSTTYSFYFTHW